MVEVEFMLEKLEKLEKEVKELEKRQKLLEDSVPSLDDIVALIEAEKDLRENKAIPLSEIESELL